MAQNFQIKHLRLILYKELLARFSQFRYKELTAVDLILQIFNNFQDAIKHLTQRRKEHVPFNINDEYDVQDLSYLILRSVFPNLQYENPHFKVGGTNSKVDLMLVSEGIDIELKMLKSSNTDEKEIIKQLKIDFNDYSTWKDLKNLIVFVYDPLNKTTNKNNFYDLNGRKSLNGVEFDVNTPLSYELPESKFNSVFFYLCPF